MPFHTIAVPTIDAFLNVEVAPIEQVVIYRGVSDASYDLLPSIGRWLGPPNQRENFERQIFEEFKSRAIGYLSIQPRNEWEWLFLAQHHGLPTRLLDWTTSPLIALRFALWHQRETDFAVYALNFSHAVITHDIRLHLGDDPLRVGQLAQVTPSFINERVDRQRSVFTIQPDPWTPLRDRNPMRKYVFPASARRQALRKLQYLGITESLLIPGLDSLARDIAFSKNVHLNYGA